PLVAIGKVFLECFHALDDFPAGADVKDLTKRTDVGVSVCRTGDDFSGRPLPTFVDIALRASILHGVVEVAEVSQVDAQPRKRVLLEHIGPEKRICPILIGGCRPEATARYGPLPDNIFRCTT